MEANQKSFLAAFVEIGNVAKACRTANLDRATIYRWRKDCPDFELAFQHACEDFADGLEDEARRRATEGVNEPVYQKGKLVGHKKKYSDGLLLAMLAAKRPEQFKPNYSVNHSGTITHAHVGVITHEMNALRNEMLNDPRILEVIATQREAITNGDTGAICIDYQPREMETCPTPEPDRSGIGEARHQEE
jgi:hypothetical protein